MLQGYVKVYRKFLALARKSYRIKLLSTHKNGDICAIFCKGTKLRRADL